MAAEKKMNPASRMGIIFQNLRGLAILLRSRYLGIPRPKRKGELKLPFLDNPVEVIWDRWDVPHIYAQSQEDLLFAQGYTHAQERFWQMEFNRRLGAGRLSEILGSVAVPLDRWMRTLRIYYFAKLQARELDKDLLPLFSTYADGVNAYITREEMPVEIELLGYQPEPWDLADSFSWVKMMAWDLSVNWETEILRAKLIEVLGPEKAAELEPPYDPSQPLIIPEGVDYSIINTEALKRAAENKRFPGTGSREGIGSNNWVLSGKRTNTGMPLLANDMHLGMTIPSIWFENHLVGPELNVSGVSLPGVPFVIAGHNPYVAWGFTNGFTDVQDLFIEHLKTEDDGRVRYEFKGEWLEAEVFQEEIKVKGADSITEKVIVTHHGPIINALAPDFTGDTPLALRWTALEVDENGLALYKMSLAKNCIEFREALRHWAVPSQNIVYADTAGDIGYSLPGKLPNRARGDGRVPVPGWTGEYEWIGYVPFEELPHQYNPPADYIATANNKVVDDGYPHWIGNDYVAGNRAQRIVELIEAKVKLSVQDIQVMQMDQVSPAAVKVRDVLVNLKGDSQELEDVLERIRKWNGDLSAKSPEASLYQVFIRRLIFRLLEPVLGDLAVYYAGKGPTLILQEGSMFGERAREWLISVLEAANSPWFDLGDGLSREDHLRIALRETVAELKEHCGTQAEDWSWGKLHQLTFNHTLGSVKPLDRFFNRGPYPIGGDGDTIWASGASSYDLSCDMVIGPPFRFIADLSDWNNSRGMLVPGQSGHLSHSSYDNNIGSWFRGEFHPMVFDRETVQQVAKSVMILKSE